MLTTMKKEWNIFSPSSALHVVFEIVSLSAWQEHVVWRVFFAQLFIVMRGGPCMECVARCMTTTSRLKGLVRTTNAISFDLQNNDENESNED
jgi:hypothetical protein